MIRKFVFCLESLKSLKEEIIVQKHDVWTNVCKETIRES